MIEYRVQVFAGLRDVVGSNEWHYKTPDPLTVKDLLMAFFNQYPIVQSLMNVTRLAVNQQFAMDPSQHLDGTEEIALIPPVSGG